jgi:ATP-dependent DNA helicase DinG
VIRILEQADESSEVPRFDLLQEVKSIFAKGGTLQNSLGFEYRAQQEEMALAYAKSLLDQKHLIFEAGTGVGKSLAYLIPSVLFARWSKRPCVIATNTISLQEQLLEKDIPTLRDLFHRVAHLAVFADFKCALLVGRANYLCQNRLIRARLGQTDLFEGRHRDELQRIVDWVEGGTLEGIRQELSPQPNPLVWDLVNADSSLCSSKRCNPENCCYRKARSQVDNADVVIVNHSLFFSLMGAGVGTSEEDCGILFPDDFLVFDEAHEMAEVASEHLGISVSSWAMETFLRQLYNPKKGKGLLSKVGNVSDFQIVEDALLATEDFFHYLHIELLGEADRLRLTQKNVLPLEIFPPLGRIVRRLVELSEAASNEENRLELRDRAKRIQVFITALSEVVELKNDDEVYWMERGGRNNHIIYLRSAPLEVSKILSEQLFSSSSSILMTSATMTHKGMAERFKSQIGALGAKDFKVESPFDYQNNMNIRIFDDCPEPQARDRAPYLDFLTEVVARLAEGIEGGTLVLFTNYADLRFCHQQLKPKWHSLGRSIYAQGDLYARSELRRRVLDEGDVLLLGAESFWKGFDAKGSCISQVILTRLPFENPSHPLLEAKNEVLLRENRSSFREITLPSAVIRFRQGVGRLIRSGTDCGDLVILDSRVLHKSYGRDFLAELPKKEFQRINLSQLINEEGKI